MIFSRFPAEQIVSENWLYVYEYSTPKATRAYACQKLVRRGIAKVSDRLSIGTLRGRCCWQ